MLRLCCIVTQTVCASPPLLCFYTFTTLPGGALGQTSCCSRALCQRPPNWCSITWCLGLEPSGAVQDVLICGWGDSTFMVALLHSMDEELPKGSQVTVLNLRPKEEVLGERPQMIHPLCLLIIAACILSQGSGSAKQKSTHQDLHRPGTAKVSLCSVHTSNPPGSLSVFSQLREVTSHALSLMSCLGLHEEVCRIC